MTKKKSYLERGAMMVDPGAETGDRSLKDLVAGVANQPNAAPSQPVEAEAFKAASTKQESEEETDYDEDSDDTDVDVDITISDDDDDMEDEDEEVDCGDPGDEGYDECMAEMEDDMMDDDDVSARSAKANIYQPPQLMTPSQLAAKFGRG